VLRGELGEPAVQGRDPRRTDDQWWHQRESGGDHFDAAGLAEVLHELLFEGGHLLLLAEADDDMTEP
jgi:hypothetical protein